MTLCIAFLAIGISMFLIPVIPGLPVYLFGGILIPTVNAPVTKDPETGELTIVEYDFWFGFVTAVFLNFFLKMAAITLQQKGIGESLSHNKWVLKNVAVNTPTMKAVEMILKRPGMAMPKVVILCGGPDWPTSVLTGILRLSLVQMLIGSQPVMINVLLVTAAGAFKLRKDMSTQWGALASVALSLGVFWNLLLMVLATYYIQDTWESNYDSLKQKRKDHLELDFLDLVGEKQTEAIRKRTEWSQLTPCTQYQLIISGGFMVFATYLMTQAQGMCWKAFEVTDDIAMLDSSFLHPPGAFAIFLFILGCISLKVYFSWQTMVTKDEVAEIAKEMEKDKNRIMKQWADEALEPPKAQSGMESLDLRCSVNALKSDVDKLVKEAEEGSRIERTFYGDFRSELNEISQRLEELEKKQAN